MRRLVLPLLGCLLLMACGASEVSENEQINAWFDEQFEEQLAFSPIQQTFLGRKTNKDKIDDFSIEAQDARLAWQHPVQHDQVGLLEFEQRLGGTRVRSLGDLVARVAQVHGNQFTDRRFIFYYQYTFVHDRFLGGGKIPAYDRILTVP